MRGRINIMKLSEVMKESKIKIHASINGHGVLLITKAAIGVRDGLLIESLTYFDEDLIFREPTKIIAVNKRDGRTYEFESQSIGPVETRYGKFHLIRCPDDGKVVNRRQAERYDIDRLGVIRINRGGDIRNALVYDISMRGIAFILDSDATCKVGDHITASFRYDPNYFHFYACEATVVRIFSIDNQIAAGCSIDSMGADLITLISNKKKEKLGIGVDDMLGIAESSDVNIAFGDKIAVNYVPPKADNRGYVKDKDPSRFELHLSPEEAAKAIPEGRREKEQIPEAGNVRDAIGVAQPAPREEILNVGDEDMEQFLSPDEAADLIPERSAAEIMERRAGRIADIDDDIPIRERRAGRAADIDDDIPIRERRAGIAADIDDDIPIRDKPSRPLREEFSDVEVQRAYDPARSLANAANSAKNSIHLPGRRREMEQKKAETNKPEPKRAPVKPLVTGKAGFVGKLGNNIDESLFEGNKNDGFLTPEQIADIIELERINKRDF